MHRRVLPACTAALAITLAALPTLASAHPGFGEIHDLAHGFTHPFTGLDHVVAMLAVGVFAAQLGGRALWLVPATFVAVMAAAGVAGMLGITIPYVETGIALSVLALGAAIAFAIRVPVAVAMALVGFRATVPKTDFIPTPWASIFPSFAAST